MKLSSGRRDLRSLIPARVTKVRRIEIRSSRIKVVSRDREIYLSSSRVILTSAGIRRELHVRVGPGGRKIPERAADLAVGRHEIRLGVLRGVAARRGFDGRSEKTGRQSASAMGRRGRRRRLSRVSAGDPPRRECTDDNAQHGNKLFAEPQKSGTLFPSLFLPPSNSNSVGAGSFPYLAVSTRRLGLSYSCDMYNFTHYVRLSYGTIKVD